MSKEITIKERLATLETYGKVAKEDREKIDKKIDQLMDKMDVHINDSNGMKRNDKLSLSALVTFFTVGAGVGVYLLGQLTGAL